MTPAAARGRRQLRSTPARGSRRRAATGDAVEVEQVDAAAGRVNDLLALPARPQLDRHVGEPWHLHSPRPNRRARAGLGCRMRDRLAVVLGTEMYNRLGVCTAPRCDRVYVDVSRNGTRRFCSTSCQNRVKAAAFRARQA